MDRRDFICKSSLAGLAGLGAMSCSFTDDKREGYVSRFNVREFGAQGDGVTPDSEAIQNALDSAGKVNGTVWFPAGIYLCHGLTVPSHVTLMADPVWIFRNEKAGAVLQLDDPSADCLLDVTASFGVRIHGLVINGIPDADKVIHGIYLNNIESWSPKEDTIVIDDTKVMNFSGHGVYLKRVWLFIIRHSQFMSNHGDGVRLLGWDGFVTDNQFSANKGNGFGCEGGHASTVMFTANRVEWNGQYGLFITGGNDWNVTGNSFDRNYGAALYVLEMTAVAVTGNVFRRCGKDSKDLGEGENSSNVILERSNGIAMTGNAFLAGQDDGGKGLFTPQVGLTISSLNCCTITGNTLYNGYMEQMIVDRGGHSQLILRDNVGCAMR